jgi:acetoacetyl-CoA synthetase
MKPGDDGPPVFLIPGAPGSILQLGPLAAAMTVSQAVFAIRPRGLDEDESPCQTLKEMAEYSISRIKAMYPRGPYLLVGYSAGGLIALEMAQQLRAAGDEVPLVVLLDTYPSREIWPLRCHAEILVRQIARAIWALRRYSPVQMSREVCRRLRSLRGYLAASGVKALPLPEVAPEGASAASRRVHMATYAAGEAYRPRTYAGKVAFVQPDEVPNLEPRRPASVWGRVLTDLDVRRIPGSHLGMVEAGAVATAAAISQCVSEAIPPQASPMDAARVA